MKTFKRWIAWWKTIFSSKTYPGEVNPKATENRWLGKASMTYGLIDNYIGGDSITEEQIHKQIFGDDEKHGSGRGEHKG
jgi:hypothetical protein